MLTVGFRGTVSVGSSAGYLPRALAKRLFWLPSPQFLAACQSQSKKGPSRGVKQAEFIAMYDNMLNSLADDEAVTFAVHIWYCLIRILLNHNCELPR